MRAGRNFASTHAGREPGAPADLLLINGTIWTGELEAWASAVAVKGGIIVEIGGEEVAGRWRQTARLVVDLGGRFAMPGLYDCHTHPDLHVMTRYNDDLEITADLAPDALAAALRDHAQRHPDKSWIFGSYWVRYPFRRAGIVPDRHWLDQVIADRPAALMDRSWGAALANSKALEEMGITAATLDPGNGYIERDPLTGEPTGILVDGAYAFVHRAMPPTPIEVLVRGYGDGLHFQASRGVVGTKFPHVCERRLEALRILDRQGRLTSRVEAAISWQDDIFPVRRRWELIAGERHHYRSERLNANAVKFHLDGTHEARSAYLATNWSGNEAWRGHLNLSPRHLADMLVSMDRAGIRVIAHCVGDAASDLFLDAVAEARRRNGPIGVRHHCAHSTVLLDENLARFHALDVVCEFSPVGWFYYPFAEARLNAFGSERSPRFFNFRGAVDARAIVVMGTDCPVSPLDPWLGFEAMITRMSPLDLDEDRRMPGGTLTLEEALHVVTINGAKAMGIEDRAGSLAPGKSADIAVLDRNLFEVQPRGGIHATQVDLTFIQGELTWDRLGQFAGSDWQAVWDTELPAAFVGV